MMTWKDEPLNGNAARLYVHSLDTPINRWQLVLVPGVLALCTRAVELGRDAAAHWELEDPIETLRTVSFDLSLRAELRLARGGTTTALEVLEVYRKMAAETVAEAGAPEWTRPVLRLWEKMLRNLRSNPILEHGRLEWLTKLLGFSEHLEQNRLSWREFSPWVYPLAWLRQLKAVSPELDPGKMIDSLASGSGIHRPSLGVLEHHIGQAGLSRRDLPRIWKLAHQLCGLCVQSHVLWPDRCPVEVGRRPCPLVTDEMVDAARTA